MITQLTKNLQHPGKVYHIADAAFHTAENLATLGTHAFWISRVPATLNEVKEFVAADLVLQPCTDTATSMWSRCLIIPAFPKSGLSVVRHQCRSSRGRRSKNGWRMTGRNRGVATETRSTGVAYEPAALVATEKWLQEHSQFRFSSRDIRTMTRKVTKKRGRSKADEPVEAVYTASAEIEYNPEIVAENRQNLERFVLATNDPELSPDGLLANYKEQGTVERGSGSSRTPPSQVVEIYLKQPSRP